MIIAEVKMRVIFFVATFSLICTISSAGVIDNGTGNNDNLIRGFESYNNELDSSPNLVANFILNMLQQPRVAYPWNYRKAKMFSKYLNPEIASNCEHYIAPNVCPVCIFRMRKSVHFQIPDDKEVSDIKNRTSRNITNIVASTTNTNTTTLSSNNSEKSNDGLIKIISRDIPKIEIPLIKDMTQQSNIYQLNKRDIRRFKEAIAHNKKENLTDKNNTSEMFTVSADDLAPFGGRIQIQNLKPVEDTSKNLELPDIFQKLFLNSWKKRSVDNETANFL